MQEARSQMSPTHPPATTKFTWEDLSKLNRPHNAHVAVRGKVYDVSSFIEKHPGGVDQLLLGAGRDVTILFESYHNFNVSKVLEKYYVGELISNELPVYREPNEFSRTVRDRVHRYFKEHNIDPKMCYGMFLRCLVLLLMTNTLWALTICCYQMWVWLSVFCACGWGVCSSLLIMSTSHDTSHFAVTHKPWVWKLLGAINDCTTGMSMYVWTHQHVVGHHVHTNVDQVDPDVFTTHEPPDVRRIHKSQKLLSRYYYQHIYLVFLYCFVGMKKRIQDFIAVYQLKNLSIRMNPLTPSQMTIFIVGKFVYITCHLLLPSLYMPLPLVVTFVLLGDFIAWYWLVIITQLTHVSADVIWPEPDKNNYIDMDWAELQVATSQDYATDSHFWNFASGALNNQIAHHLFPGVLQCHYPGVTRVVRETCREFNIEFRHTPSAWEAMKKHVYFLKRLGQGTD
jgi:fatty acid desaturase/predicted heme/steroid binding protein